MSHDRHSPDYDPPESERCARCPHRLPGISRRTLRRNDVYRCRELLDARGLCQINSLYPRPLHACPRPDAGRVKKQKSEVRGSEIRDRRADC